MIESVAVRRPLEDAHRIEPATALPAQPIRTIVVPLDGSPQAHTALDLGQVAAARTGAQLVVIHAAATTEAAPRSRHERPLSTSDALALLRAAGDGARAAGVSAQEFLIQGRPGRKPGEGILDAVRLSGAQLLVMATHGRTGLQRALLGSVADDVLADASVPVVLVGPRYAAGGEPHVWPRQRTAGPLDGEAAPPPWGIMVPLDGSAEAETAVLPTAILARALAAEIVLLRVMPEPYVLLGPAFGADAALSDAAMYLGRIRERLQAAGISPEAVRTVVRVADRERVAETLLDEAARSEVSMLALTMQRRNGVQQPLFGSVASAIIARATLPILVAPAPGTLPAA